MPAASNGTHFTDLELAIGQEQAKLGEEANGSPLDVHVKSELELMTNATPSKVRPPPSPNSPLLSSVAPSPISVLTPEIACNSAC